MLRSLMKKQIHTIFKEATCISRDGTAVIPLYVIPEMVRNQERASGQFVQPSRFVSEARGTENRRYLSRFRTGIEP